MVNLLPEKEKNFIKKEYSIRFLTTILVLLLVSILLSTFFLLPGFIILNVKENTAVEEINILKKSIQNKDSVETEKKLKSIQAEVDILGRQDARISLSKIIDTIIKNKPDKIYITDILYNKIQKNGGNEEVITVRGKTNERDLLLDFKKTLTGITSFKRIDLPLSNLTKDEDIYFLLDIVLEKIVK